ncbi:colanic acid biosynthesis glycosyltransferase WcaL [Mycobacterium lehmannii]|uniref:Colanic acid biosynthesis glycosyltransferase WcaL n=1 Tax=Mycobacterium lehmannii TaxID=2048550 RepID=A0A101AER3_9MYCO|nr:glycosyltransferase [Mycobacterium lehmannii]KUI21253.1 colanic acid biosynthesis glycosyltransferase WcaL [Mycobacterium lehmannii]
MSAARIDYLVSRFPQPSETFIVRELDALASSMPYTFGLRSLFPAHASAVHDIARKWVPQLRRPSAAEALLGLGWATARNPRVLASVIATVTREYVAHPSRLARALVTVALACAHARELQRSKVAVHLHAHYATYPALAAWVCHRLLGVGYSFTAHAHDLYIDQSMLAIKIAEADFAVTISEYNRRFLDRFASPGTAVTVVHCGIDLDKYPFRERAMPAEGPIRALCVATLGEKKGHQVLFRALAIGGPGVDRIQLDLIGSGPLRDCLGRLADELGINDRITFHGSRTETEVRDALAVADMFILPSVIAADGQMEGLPVSLMEALACGLPSVSTALSGIPEIVLDRETGLLAIPGDAQSLRDAMESIIGNPSAAKQYARAGRKLVEQQFDIHTATAALSQLFEQHSTWTAGST